jgi:hypothetical protein
MGYFCSCEVLKRNFSQVIVFLPFFGNFLMFFSLYLASDKRVGEGP